MALKASNLVVGGEEGPKVARRKLQEGGRSTADESLAMNEEEARAILAQELREWRGRPYAALAVVIGETSHMEVAAPSGAHYQLEVSAVWDDRPGGNVLVIGSIDDGGLRAFVPLSDDFIVAPDGHFVGEQRRGNRGERPSL